MTTTTPGTTTISVSDKMIASYFVVPVVPDNGSSESVYYYEAVPDQEKWRKVSSKDLNARGQGHDAGKVKLSQPTLEEMKTCTGLPYDKLDQTVSLYAGVAKTLIGTDDLQCLFPLGQDGALTIPVTAKTTRGLILVFSKAPQTGMPPYPVTQLIASTDPEIKNTTLVLD